MKSISFEVLENPVFLAGAAASIAALIVLRLSDYAAAAAETRRMYDRTRGINLAHPAARIRFGRQPIVGENCGVLGLLNPVFLMASAFREPLSVLPVGYAWMEVVLGDAETGICVAAAVLVWRLVFDFSTMPPDIPSQRQRTTVGLKLVWVVSSGVWLATLFICMVCAMFVLMAIAVFAATGGRKQARSK